MWELAGTKRAPESGLAPKASEEHRFDLRRPLGHRSPWAFLLLYKLLSHDGARADELRRRITGVSTSAFDNAVRELSSNGVIHLAEGHLYLNSTLPHSYRDLVGSLGAIVSKRDPKAHYDAPAFPAAPRAFQSASDGAPRIFGSDIRLRSLMAVAKYGPLRRDDLSRCIGRKVLEESSDFAPFGRGAIVHVSGASGDAIIELHARHPLRVQLRNMLLAIERRHPVPYLPITRRALPSCSVPQWKGDILSTFGGPIATNALFCIGVLGWTFEALCVNLCTGFHRENVKTTLSELESSGILVGSRGRRPGFDPRILTISDAFCAKKELLELLQVAVRQWPSFEKRCAYALRSLPAKTLKHLGHRDSQLRSRSSHGRGAIFLSKKGNPCAAPCTARFAPALAATSLVTG